MRLLKPVSVMAMALAALQPLSAAPEPSDPPLETTLPSDGYKPVDKDERGLWMQADEAERNLKNSRFVIKDEALNAYVRDVFCRTVGQAKCGHVRIYISRTPYFNASMMPNGTMQIWSGLLLRMRNEAQLAAVLGHEFAHYEKRHGILLFRDIKKKTSAAAWLSFVPFGFVASMGIISSIFAYNRDMEREADSESLNMLAANGYNPEEVSKVWGQLRDEMDATAAARGKKSRKDKNGGIFATHPPTAERMTELAKKAAAMKVESDSVAARALYVGALGKWWPAFIDDQVKLNDFGASDLLIKSLAGDIWTADLLYARGELYRSRGKVEDLKAAIGYFQQGISSGACFADCWRGLGLAQMRSGAAEDGKASLKEYLARDPDAHDRALISAMIGT
jgi:beta-barrel assembly-enhancing protease